MTDEGDLQMDTASPIRSTPISRRLKRESCIFQRIFQRRASHSRSWPVYRFSCRHTEDVCAQFGDLLSSIGLKDTASDRRQYEETLFRAVREKNIKLNIVFSAQMSRVDCNTIDRRLDTVSRIIENDMQQDNISCLISKYISEPIPLVIFAMKEEKDAIAKVFKEETLQHKRMIVLLYNENGTHQGTTATDSSGFDRLAGYFVSETYIRTVLEDIDNQLERYILDIVRVKTNMLSVMIEYVSNHGAGVGNIEDYKAQLRCKSFRLRSSSRDYGEHIKELVRRGHEIRELHCEMKQIFQRSKVPDQDKPQFSDIDTRLVNETNVRMELKKDTRVIGYAVEFGTMVVFVDKDLGTESREETRHKIESIMKKNRCTRYSVKYASKNYEEMSKSGAQIGSPPNCGTLGGFAYFEPQGGEGLASSQSKPVASGPAKQKGKGNEKLCALISKHVALAQPNRKLCHRNVQIGDILAPFADLDIAAAVIKDGHRLNCEVTFRNEDGDTITCKLFDFGSQNVEHLPGLEVHIWGAETSPGLGKITSIYYTRTDDDTEGPCLIIKNRRSVETAFCKKGDSGAIVLAQIDVREECQYALAMVIGNLDIEGENNDSFVALKLKSGLEELSETHKGTFTLCG